MDILTPPAEFPPGEYAIVELFGHTTLVGRFSEVERFGTKMLALEPLFRGELLSPAFHGGAAIYRLTPCSARVAWERQPQQEYQLPAAIRAIVPDTLLPSPTEETQDSGGSDHYPGDSEDDEEAERTVDIAPAPGPPEDVTEPLMPRPVRLCMLSGACGQENGHDGPCNDSFMPF